MISGSVVFAKRRFAPLGEIVDKSSGRKLKAIKSMSLEKCDLGY